ncbi:MAG: hypothetical protein JWL62_2583 [Hyphomicrobiales bacterium]|nr:hypothetical protein [Hyphomicrobiales bacterium]
MRVKLLAALAAMTFAVMAATPISSASAQQNVGGPGWSSGVAGQNCDDPAYRMDPRCYGN